MSGIKYNPLINGTAYDWSNIIINIFGRTIIGVSKISYDETQDMEDTWGAGVNAVNRGFGNKVATASITLYQEEVQALQTIASTIQDIPEFDITVMYASDLTNIKTDVIKNCRFKNNKRDMSQNDMNSEVEIELLTSHIEWDV